VAPRLPASRPAGPSARASEKRMAATLPLHRPFANLRPAHACPSLRSPHSGACSRKKERRSPPHTQRDPQTSGRSGYLASNRNQSDCDIVTVNASMNDGVCLRCRRRAVQSNPALSSVCGRRICQRHTCAAGYMVVRQPRTDNCEPVIPMGSRLPKPRFHVVDYGR
jgi:hypothetical protein